MAAREMIKRWGRRDLGVLSSKVQDAAQHCDQLSSLAGDVGEKKLSENVHKILYIDIIFAGRAAELPLPY